ncbi:MAG: hypothetical protein AAF738_08660, partial [Bacteroidota bacterium]
LAQDLKSAKSTTVKDNTVRMEVAEDVVIGGKYRVILTGSSASGIISYVQKRRGFGRGAALEVRAISTRTADGQVLSLIGKPYRTESNRQKKRRAGFLLFFGILFLVGGLLSLSLAGNILTLLFLCASLTFTTSALTMRGDEIEMIANADIIRAITAKDIRIQVEAY